MLWTWSSFHVIFGQSSRGGYLCIPEWSVACQLASYPDIFWNQEQLKKQLGKVDAITVATAIKEANLLIKEKALPRELLNLMCPTFN